MPRHTFLITGGAGFIGSHLAQRLAEQDYRVRVLDDFSTGKRENLAHLQGNVEIVEGSITDQAILKKAVGGADYVLHQAALPSVARSLQNPAKSLEINALGTLFVLTAAREAKVKRVVLASSSSVYGANVRLPKVETMAPVPISPYAVSKWTAEQYAYVYHRVHGLETVTLRYFNVFGPRQDPLSAYAAVIPKFIRAMLEGRPPEIYGDGRQSRDFTYVENVVQANVLACKAPAKACGKVYNVAGGGRVSLRELVTHLNDLLGTRLHPVFLPERPGDVKHSQAAIALAKCHLDYRLQVPFLEGLRKTIQALSCATAGRTLAMGVRT